MFPAEYYFPIYIHLMLFMVLCSWMWLYNSDSSRIINERRNNLDGWLLAIFFIIFLGLRPLSGVFVDTMNYALSFQIMQSGDAEVTAYGGDWLFYLMISTCSKIMGVHGFFLLVETCYIAPVILACKRWFPNNLTLALLFCFTAFSFFAYGTNTIRSGMAMSFVILASSYIYGDKRDKILAIVSLAVAIFIHKSAALPIYMMVTSLLYKNTKAILLIWSLSLLLSLAVGESISNIFDGFGFDARLSMYINSDSFKTGFRFDFVLYGFMPILLGYYCVIKKKVYDNNYLLLLHTYILSNAFWIIVIRTSFSDRFAYLSWFLYPILLAYPLLKFDLWGDRQGRWCAFILTGNIAFTYLMWMMK